jgi:hemoglobin/transferrin/lactoferrin receptor protein
MKKTYLTFAIAAVFAQNAYADDNKVELDSTTVVAVANKQERPIMEVVGSVSVINADDISRTNSENITDTLRYESNIHMENGGTRFGATGINIRGIGQNRVAVEVDGITNAKQFSIGSYASATAQFPDIDLIKNVEILNGPASTLYGSDAIGGIVSIQTWKPEDLTRLNDNNRYTKFRLGYDGKTHGRVISAMTAWDTDTAGGIIGFSQRDGKGLINHDSNHSARDFSDWDEQSLFGKFVVNTSGSNNLTIGFSGSQRDNDTQINSFIGQGRFSRTTELSGQDNSNNYKVTLDYDFNINNAIFDDGILRAYIAKTTFEQDTFEKRSSRRGTPLAQFRHFEYEQQNTGLELNLNKQFISNATTHNLIYGLEYKSADIEELRDGTETNLTTGITLPIILGEVFPRRDFPNSKVNELGLFILDEITFDNSAWTVVPALRFDYYDLNPNRDVLFDANGTDTEIVSINDSNFSPKLGIMYQLNEDSNIFAQYVRGFRAPPFDDVNIGLNLPIFNIRAIANPDLKSETSDGFELGYRYFGDTQQFNITGFYTDYSDFIETKARIGIDPDTGTVLFQSRNIDEAEIYGVEVSHQWQINETISSYTTFAWTRGNNKTNDQPLNSISPAKLVNNLSWQSKNNKWNVDLYSTFNAALDRIDESNPTDDFFKPAGFAIFDVLVGYEINQKQKLRLGLFNVGNKKYWDWQQVRNFDANDAIINALSKPSRSVSLSYSIEL